MMSDLFGAEGLERHWVPAVLAPLVEVFGVEVEKAAPQSTVYQDNLYHPEILVCPSCHHSGNMTKIEHELELLSNQVKELYNIKDNLEERLGAWNPELVYFSTYLLVEGKLAPKKAQLTPLFRSPRAVCLWTETAPAGGGLLACASFSDSSLAVSGCDGLIAHLRLLGRGGRPLLHCVSYQTRRYGPQTSHTTDS
ncbi:unnamed protein product, partial [Mesorhabditis spiculigera]